MPYQQISEETKRHIIAAYEGDEDYVLMATLMINGHTDECIKTSGVAVGSPLSQRWSSAVRQVADCRGLDLNIIVAISPGVGVVYKEVHLGTVNSEIFWATSVTSSAKSKKPRW